jgi:poly(3-hydroxybutyrate) depolymerase
MILISRSEFTTGRSDVETRRVLLVRALLASLLVYWSTPSCGQGADRPDVQYGRFEVSRTAAQLVDLVGSASMLDALVDDETISWRIYVPETYDASKPAGLMVYISPTSSGEIRGDWQSVIDSENLIWIGANQSGNRTRTNKRILLATLAPYLASESYEIDPDRVYLSGFSGGGKAAGLASVHLARLFKGAIFICGAESWSDAEPEQLLAAAANRYVFVTGSRDFNNTLTRRVHRKFERAGLVNSRLMVISGMEHSTPDVEHFREAILYLDRRE